ncbi:MAG: flagellar type III secretion system pore protein FliP [Fibrobacterales bacterium]
MVPLKYIVLLIVGLICIPELSAQIMPKVTLGFEESESVDDVAVTLEIVALMTVLTLAPSIIIMLTSFTRIVIVLNFLKQALGTMNAPPNQVVMGLTLFLTFFIMTPTFNAINDNALQPYLAKEINHEVAIEEALTPIREFMLRQTSESELALFLRVSKTENPKNIDELSLTVIIPAFILSEIKTAFIIGFLLYIPFLVIDMTVASVLMSMGMMMLPPVMISMPFKLILFVLVDGWHLVVQQVVLSFH